MDLFDNLDAAEILRMVYVTLLCVLAPLLVMWINYRFKFVRKLGVIALTYVVGCLCGLCGLIPDDSQKLLTTIASAVIPLAIPMLLFSSDVKAWARLTPSFTKSLVCGVLGSAIAIVIGYIVFGRGSDEPYAEVGGMLMGLYTGGNVNLASVKAALDVDDFIYLQVQVYSMIMSALYLVFVIVAGKRVLGLILPDFPFDKQHETHNGKPAAVYDDQLFYGIFRPDNMKNLFLGFSLTLMIIIIAGATAKLFFAGHFQEVFVLLISLLAVLASLNDKVRTTPRTFEAGTYLILIFSMAVSAQVKSGMFSDIDPNFFYFVLTVTAGSLLLHGLFGALLRIDTDTTLATSISLICSPPFVPVIAGTLKNRAIIGPGIAVGLVGYAIGTYLGLLMVWVCGLLE